MAMRDDLRYLRVSLIVGAVLLAAGAGVVVGMQKWAVRAAAEQSAAQARLAEARGKLASAREEELEIKRNLQQYRALVAKGIVGEENRLGWIERINAIRIAHKLFDIRSDIAEQRKLDNPVSGPDIMVSHMDISLPLLHEGDLFQLLSDLRVTDRSYFQVKSCNLARGAPIDRRVLAPTMTATCGLDFYSIRERVPPKAAGS